ncbi:MAG TPA: hypothetical protein PK788_09875, partial [Gemmatimonadaceae bacterium]|nr:hypothetical protein [Gemmatimonadaceae bacterium]
ANPAPARPAAVADSAPRQELVRSDDAPLAQYVAAAAAAHPAWAQLTITMPDAKANLTRIAVAEGNTYRPDLRWTLDLEYERDTPLFETERNITREGVPYDLMGNVTAPGGGEIDPALSALLGQSVTTASVAAGAAGGGEWSGRRGGV